MPIMGLRRLGPRNVIQDYHIDQFVDALEGLADAYDVAVADGFTGTRGEWLQSLVGPPGAGIVPKGSVATVAERDAIVNPAIDDVWTVDEDGHAYAWDGSAWVDIGVFRGPGGMDTELRARTDPGAAGTLGRALRWGPGGKTAWGERVISADWYSSLNDAITAAGQGGTVRLSEQTTYNDTSGDPILLIPGLTIEGDRDTSRINTAGPGLAVKTPASMCDRVTLRGFGLSGGGVGTVGLDARGLTRSLIEGVDVAGYTDAAVWFGGDNPAYYASWTNEMRGCEITALANGAGVRFSGVTSGGAVTANNITLAKCVIFVANDPDSIGIDLQGGDSNLFMHNDVGYSGGDGIPFAFASLAADNFLAFNRVENCWRSVYMNGGQRNRLFFNMFMSAHATYHAAELEGNPGYPLFLYNSYSSAGLKPNVFKKGLTYNLRVHDLGDGAVHSFLNGIMAENTSGGIAVDVRRTGDAYRRFGIFENSSLSWWDPVTGVMQTRLRPTGIAGPYMEWDDATFVKVPKHASLPTATSAMRGSMIRLEGASGVADGLYWCRKTTADTYEWQLLS